MEACRTAALAAPGKHTGSLRIKSANESIPLLGPRRRSMQHAQARERERERESEDGTSQAPDHPVPVVACTQCYRKSCPREHRGSVEAVARPQG
eukprot:1475799-Pyramimonas_sp.AAC.1